MREITIQLIGFAGTLLYFASFQCRKNKNLFRTQFFSYILYTIHLLLLGAWTGGVSYVINCIRSLFLAGDNKFLKSRTTCVFLCVTQLSALALTWDGWVSLLPVAANIASTIGGYTGNPRKIRACGMFVNSPLWIVYDVIVGSWAGILDEAVSEISMIVSVVRFGWKDLDKTE